MSYVVIARKYRPQNFDEMIGQEAVRTTLKNAITMDRVAHAYLFTGPRGVGKTSMARIFSKALNCKNGPTAKPCGKCVPCVEIEEGRSLDVMEIDGASNRGIDDVRSIRESIKFSPAYGKFKIYIIDEVHQITTDGFNALLKTLEEPPAHAKFIFATTSASKVPATVLSRCQRFDFKRIPTKTIASTLASIAKQEKFKISEDAIYEIAKSGDGSLRDAESILDQIGSFSKGEITAKDVASALGSMNPEELFDLFEAIASRDASRVLDFVDAMLASGRDAAYFLEKCLEHVRNLLVVKVSANLAELVEASDSYCERLGGQARAFSKDDLFYLFSVLMGGVQNLRRFNLKRAPLEMTLLRCALREPMVGVADAEIKLGQAIQTASKQAPAAPAAPARESKKNSDPAPVAPAVAPESSASAVSVDVPVAPPSAAPRAAQASAGSAAASDRDLSDIWTDLVKRVRTEKMSAASFLQEGEPLSIEGDTILIGFSAECAFNAETLAGAANIELLEKHASDLLRRKTRVEFRLASAPESSGPNKDSSVLKTALGIFGGRVVRS